MQKVALPGAEDGVLAELPGTEANASAEGRILELEPQRTGVGRLVDDLGDGREVRLVDARRVVHGRRRALRDQDRQITHRRLRRRPTRPGSRQIAVAVSGGDVDRGEDLDQVLAGVAGARAAAAAGAQHLAEAQGIDRELVVEALSEAHVLVLARVVARGVGGELARLAGVPAAASRAAPDAVELVDDVEAVARRADRGAGATAVAAHAEGGEQWVFEVRVDPVAHRLGVDLQVGGDAGARVGAKALGRARVAAARRSVRGVLRRGRAPFRSWRSTMKPPSTGVSSPSAARVLSGSQPTALQKHDWSSIGQARLKIVVAARRPFQSSSA